MLKIWIAALGLAVAAGAGAAQAQTTTESTRWLVPNLTDPDSCCQGDFGSAIPSHSLRVGVYNMGAAPADVRLVAMTNGRAAASPAAVVRTLAPGAALDQSMGGRFDYLLVIASGPVTVSAVTTRTTGPAVQTNNDSAAAPGRIVAVIQDGQRTIHDINGYVRTAQQRMTVPAQAIPINCTGAPSQHFACSGGGAASPMAGQVAPRPGENLPAAPPPPQPEGRYTRTPGGSIPGDAPRMTPTPRRTPR
jgi:hypothetical protein